MVGFGTNAVSPVPVPTENQESANVRDMPELEST